MAEKRFHWRNVYPWGRRSPEARIEDLREARLVLDRQERLFEARVKEIRIDFERKRESIENDIRIAELCASDELRREAVFYAFRLEEAGVDVWDRIGNALTRDDVVSLRVLWEEKGSPGDDGETGDAAGVVSERDIETSLESLVFDEVTDEGKGF